jgi:LmbE family N-acetylglucosaminyl deacetylase
MSDRYAPPGETTTIHAQRVLVLAPHADDDVLGCGGLLARLAESGAEIGVLFLTDSSGGQEVTEGQAEYSTRRRREAARALAVLGVEHVEHLDIPDGSLSEHLDEASEAIGRAVLARRPDLLLSVSPLEVTRDHQAAFAALHRALSPLRGDADLDAAVADLQILLYEVNRLAFPDVLVDVSDQLSKLTEAITLHASQLELHNYLDGAIGVRRFRTQSLPPTVQAAEGYRRLTSRDFVTHSLAELIRTLGGLPEIHEVRAGPRISVIVRTMDRHELLQEALASLADGGYRRVEVVLVNDGGPPPPLPDPYPFPIVSVNIEHNSGRAAAANAGVDAATGDYVAFLDDDDLAYPEHLATLAGLVSAPGVRVAYTDAAVGVYELEPNGGWQQVERRLPYSRDFDAELLLVDNYIPFNTLLIERALLGEAGPFDPSLEFFEDWDMLIRLSRSAPFHHHRQVTCEYRHFRTGGRQILGEQASRRRDFLAMKARVIDRHRDRLTPELVARVVARLREEAVQRGEESSARAAEATRLRAEHAELADAFHRLNGERESLTRERDDLRAESSRHRERIAALEDRERQLVDQEGQLRQLVDDQGNHLERLYAEIERLNGLIRAMESTKAWRLHRVVEKLRGRAR